MAGLQELFQAFDMFNKGVSTFQKTRSIQEANNQLQQLNQQGMDLQNRLIAERDIGNQLALSLSKGGSSAQEIAAATQGLGVSAGAIFQAEENRNLQKSNQSFQKEILSLQKQLEAQTLQLKEQSESRLLTQRGKQAEKLQAQSFAGQEKLEGVRAQFQFTRDELKRLANLEAEAKKEKIALQELTPFGFEIIPGQRPVAANQKAVTEMNTAFQIAAPKIKELKDLVSKYGTTESIFGNQQVRGKMAQLSSDLKVLYNSHFAKLGALAEADLKILEDIIPSPGTFQLKEATLAKLKGLGKGLSDQLKSTAEANKYQIVPGSKADQWITDLSLDNLDSSINSEIDKIAEFNPAVRAQIDRFKQVLRNPNHPDYQRALNYLASQGDLSVFQPLMNRGQ